MKQSRSTAILLTLALIFCLAAPAGAFEIGARALYWYTALQADMRLDAAGLVGNQVNLEDNLNVDSNAFLSVEVFGGLGKHNLSLAYTPLSYSGSTTLTQKVDFGGQSFPAGTYTTTDMNLRMLDLDYQYTFLDLENILAGFSLGAIGKIKYIDGDTQMSAPGISAKQPIREPIPMVGVNAHIGILLNLLEARARLSVGSSGNYEALADLSVTPFPFLDIHAGYKVVRLRIDDSDLYLDSTFSGPYLGLTVSF